MSSEIYVSTDVEADGPIPGPHSMLSFASAAYTEDKQLIATFESVAVDAVVTNAAGCGSTSSASAAARTAWPSARR